MNKKKALKKVYSDEINPEKEHLIKFLSRFPNLDSSLISQLSDMIPVIAPKKGTVLMSEGEVPTECYFVLKGLIRQYQFIDGTDRTTEFYTESNGAVSSIHYKEQSPSHFQLECMEDCFLITRNRELDQTNFEKFPALMEITMHLLENNLNKVKDTYSKFILSSPKERYLHFLETRPDLLNRVSLHQIASYLGMAPESLSRIRKRIVTEV